MDRWPWRGALHRLQASGRRKTGQAGRAKGGGVMDSKKEPQALLHPAVRMGMNATEKKTVKGIKGGDWVQVEGTEGEGEVVYPPPGGWGGIRNEGRTDEV